MISGEVDAEMVRHDGIKSAIPYGYISLDKQWSGVWVGGWCYVHMIQSIGTTRHSSIVYLVRIRVPALRRLERVLSNGRSLLSLLRYRERRSALIPRLPLLPNTLRW